MKLSALVTICALLLSPFVVTGGYWLVMSRPQIATIADAARPAELLLRAQRGAWAPTGISVTGTGNLDGIAEIALLDGDGRVQQTALLRSSADFRLAGDWYEPEATLRYTPISGASGTIGLRYRFHGSGTGDLMSLVFTFLVSSAVAAVFGRILLSLRAKGSSRQQLEARVAALRRRLKERGR
jgi:hypothetical protein